MTAPAQPPDPRVQRIASAMGTWQHTPGDQSHVDLARVLVEELGGREESATDVLPSWYRMAWDKVTDALTFVNPEWYHSSKDIGTHAANTIRHLGAQQRENAETIKALRERVATAESAMHKEPYRAIRALEGRAEMAERANIELDNARQSAEQSARDLRENNNQLRAQLDAIKGAQEPYAYDVKGWGIFRCKDELTLAEEMRRATQMTYRTDLKPIPLYRHPAPALPAKGDGCEFCLGAKGGVEGNGNRFNGILVCDYCTALLLDAKKSPALPVVGTMKVTKRADGGHAIVGVWDENFAQSVPEAGSYNILLGAPLPTEGGK